MSIFSSSQSQSGIAHFIIPAIIAAAVGIAGTYMIVASHAASRPPDVTRPGTIEYSVDAPDINNLFAQQNRLPADLQISGTIGNLQETVDQQHTSKKGPQAKVSKKERQWSRSSIVKRSQAVANSFWTPIAQNASRTLCSESRRGNTVRIRAVALADQSTLAYTYHNGRSKVKGHDCTIYINSTKFPSRLNLLQAYDLCYTTVHEYGHLYGYGHSSDKNLVMYPAETVQQERHRLQRCLQLFI